MTAPPPVTTRALILGDSWIKGLPFQGPVGFGRLLLDRPDIELLDLSEVSRITSDTVEHDLETIRAFAPAFALVNLGGAESIVFPRARATRALERVAPPAWRGFGGLQARALYSRQPRRRLRQRLETLVKTLTKQVLIRLAGGERRLTVPELEPLVRTVLTCLTTLGCEVAVVGITLVDPWLSPRSNASFRATNEMLTRVAAEHDVFAVLPYEHLRRWEDFLTDRVHLNADGHRHLAAVLRAELAGTSPRWRELLAP